MNFGLVNNLQLVYEIFNLLGTVPQFRVTEVEATLNFHIFPLLEIITSKPVCLFHVSNYEGESVNRSQMEVRQL
jgi:hypothetical protein